MGRGKSLSSQISFLLYASQLSGTSILCFPGLTIEGGCSLMGPGWQVLLFPLRTHWLIVEAAMLKDCDILGYWYGRKYSISQLYLLSSEITKTRQLGHHHQPLVHPVSPSRSRLGVLFWEPICIMGLCFEMARSEHSRSSICKPLVLLWLSPPLPVHPVSAVLESTPLESSPAAVFLGYLGLLLRQTNSEKMSLPSILSPRDKTLKTDNQLFEVSPSLVG